MGIEKGLSPPLQFREFEARRMPAGTIANVIAIEVVPGLRVFGYEVIFAELEEDLAKLPLGFDAAPDVPCP